MVCNIISSIETFADFLVYPVGCDYYFYLKIFLGLFIIMTWTVYAAEKRIRQNAEMLSSLAVSSLAILILALIGSLIKNTQDIAMVSGEILLYILAFTIPFILIWIFKD